MIILPAFRSERDVIYSNIPIWYIISLLLVFTSKYSHVIFRFWRVNGYCNVFAIPQISGIFSDFPNNAIVPTFGSLNCKKIFVFIKYIMTNTKSSHVCISIMYLGQNQLKANCAKNCETKLQKILWIFFYNWLDIGQSCKSQLHQNILKN